MPDFCGIELAHPVINASGTFDAIAARRVYGDALLADFPFSAFVSKTITPEPRAGNEPQRIWETPAGMINSIGLPNKGLEGFLAEDLPQLAELPVPLIVSVMATEPRGLRAPGQRAWGRGTRWPRSSSTSPAPTSTPGLIVGEQPSETEALLEALRPLTAKPLIVKLTPNVADSRRGRRGGRAGWGGRGLADQHAEGERDRSGDRRARDRGRARRALRPRGEAGGVAQVRAVAAAVQHPDRRHGRDLERRRCA